MHPPAVWEKFLDAILEGHTVTKACDLVHIYRKTFYSHMDADPAFRKAYERALAKRITIIDDAVYASAVKGNVQAQALWLRRNGLLDGDAGAGFGFMQVNVAGNGGVNVHLGESGEISIEGISDSAIVAEIHRIREERERLADERKYLIAAIGDPAVSGEPVVVPGDILPDEPHPSVGELPQDGDGSPASDDGEALPDSAGGAS